MNRILGCAFSTQEMFAVLTKHISKEDLSDLLSGALWDDILKHKLRYIYSILIEYFGAR